MKSQDQGKCNITISGERTGLEKRENQGKDKIDIERRKKQELREKIKVKSAKKK